MPIEGYPFKKVKMPWVNEGLLEMMVERETMLTDCSKLLNKKIMAG